MYKKTVLIVLLFFSFIMKGQISSEQIPSEANVFPKEKTSIQVNSQLLLAGELLQYKTYSLNFSNSTSNLSKLMYVSMRDENDSIVFSHKILAENGVGHGDFFLPSTLKTGIYRLISYTNFSRNNSKDPFDQKIIYVINTFVKDPKTNIVKDSLNIVSIKSGTASLENSQNATNGISINTDMPSYGPRSKVSVKIENPLGKEGFGNYTLSVRKIETLQIVRPQENSKNELDASAYYLPEIRGEIISGKIEAKTPTTSVENKVVALTIPGKDYIFKLAKTDNQGRFFFSIDESYQTSNSIVQVNEPNFSDDYKIILDKKAVELGKNTNKNSLVIDPALKEWLLNRSVQLQIENGYFNIKKDSILSSEPAKSFYGNLGTVYLLDDYTRFPTVRETFVEVITLAAVRKEANTDRFLVYNEYDPERRGKFNSIDPLVLMDGIMVQNNDLVLNYNAKDIKSIRVVPQAYRYGPKIYSGIISIVTKKGDFNPNLKEDALEYELQSPLKTKSYYAPNYANGNLQRIPDYRVQLLWMPNVELSTKEFSTTFYTSDVPGTYEITFEGFSKNGTSVMARKYFTVD